MCNFSAIVICVFLTVAEFFQGDIGVGLIDIAMALINLPFFIKWIKEDSY